MNELEKNYLAHHGILGQRWHKRNGPPYPLDAGDHSKSEKEAGYKKSLDGGRNEELYDRKAKKKEAKRVTKQLNKMDKDLAYEKREARDAKADSDWYDKKIAKKESKGKKVSEKLQNKSKEARAKYEKELADVKRGQEEVNKILNSIDSDTFDVKAKETIRTTNTGKDWAAAFVMTAGSAAGMSALGAPFYFVYTPMNYEKGTKYKVKERKPGEEKKEIKIESDKSSKMVPKSIDQAAKSGVEEYKRNHGGRDGKEQKAYVQNKLERAKTSDKWDLNFLEAIQNSKMDYENDTKKMLKEYKIYLENPEDYWKNRAPKLPQAY